MGRSTELRVLGGVALCHEGATRPLGGPKAQHLLSVLVAHRHTAVSTDRLVNALWGDRPPRSATATVQSQVSRLRSNLAPGFTIDFVPSGYRLDAPDGDIDAARFESLLTRAQALEPPESIPLLESAISLWHGAAFGAFASAHEVQGEAVRLEELRLVATDEWAEARMTTGDAELMVGELESLVTLHPFRERYWRLLMLALYRSGRQAEALRRAAALRSMLGDEVGLDMSPAARELEAQILADDPRLHVSPRASRARRSVDPAPHLLGATSFIGREPDVLTLSTAVRDQAVVTVTGPGGVGKTRLAMRVAGALVEHFDDGVIVVEFAPLRDPGGAAQMVANALDIQQRQYRTIESTIEEFLASTDCLLLLDNCEHVTDAVAPLVDRLRSSCPQLRILATSREPLGLAGEYVEVLTPLELPAPGASLASEIGDSAAVELFVERAAAATPGFVLTDDNASVVADVCRRLDGLPLGLELAAARLRTMGIDVLGARLRERSGLLGQTQRGADGRQRTLRDLVEWSHDLLDPAEQEVFQQLAVFAGGFDLCAAEAVCALAPDQLPAIAHLSSLVEKSMVLLVDPDTPRYRLLEPLREFGLDRLSARHALEETEDRHLDWFLAFAREGAAGLDGPDEARWASNLDQDFANLRAAHLIALRRQDAVSALQLVASLREYAIRRVQYEITNWALETTAIVNANESPDFPTALALAAYGRWVQGDMETAVELAHTALDAHGVDEPSASGLPERVLANALFYLARPDEAFRWMDRMFLSARRSASNARLAHALYMRSVGHTSVGETIRGAVLAGEARSAAEAANSPTAEAQFEYALGLALETTDPEEALGHLERSSLMAAQAGNRWIEAFSLTEVHWLRARQGKHLPALIGYADVVDIWYRGGDWVNQWLSIRRMLSILIDLDAFEAAAVLHGALSAVGASNALPFEPAAAEQLDTNVVQLRSLLGPAGFAEAVRQGAAMTDSEVVGYVKRQIVLLTRDVDGSISDSSA